MRLLDELHSTDELARENADTRLDAKSNRIFFRSSPFSILGASTLAELLSVMQLREYAAGDHLIEQGDPAEFLLLILSGMAWARVRDTPKDRPPVGKFSAGDIVGEMSLITDEPRTADVVAETPVRALQLSASDFHVLTERHPDLRVVLTDVMADRLGHAKFDGLGGKDIHGYQVVQCVGRGGMGVVYEALDVTKGTRVALKMMNHRLIYQPNALRRFRREAAILKTLEHPSVARLYECFSAYKTEFLAMEFCPGPTLAEAIRSRGPLGESFVRRLMGHLAVALKYVHGRGIVHRDLKPSNIVLTGRIDETARLRDRDGRERLGSVGRSENRHRRAVRAGARDAALHGAGTVFRPQRRSQGRLLRPGVRGVRGTVRTLGDPGGRTCSTSFASRPGSRCRRASASVRAFRRRCTTCCATRSSTARSSEPSISTNWRPGPGRSSSSDPRRHTCSPPKPDTTTVSQV